MNTHTDELRLPDEDPANDANGFYDTSNPILAPPKDPKIKKRNWKRKLIGWSLLLLAALTAVVGGYYLLKISHVDVHVLADSRRKPSEPKPQASPTVNENALSAEAINIAREAIGADATLQKANQTPPPTVADTASHNYSTSTPVLGPVNDFSSTTGAPAPNSVDARVSEMRTSPDNSPILQSHANTTQSLFVEDPPAKSAQPKPSPVLKPVTTSPRSESIPETAKHAVLALPPFGAMLPIRTQSAIFTLRNDTYARLEITRDTAGEGWSLTKGTVFIGRTRGSDLDRAYVNIIGYVDPHENRLIKVGGDVLGTDGASGLQGKRVPIDKTALGKTLANVAAKGLQTAGMMAGAISGRGTVVVNGSGMINPITDDAGHLLNRDEKRSFVKIDAGQTGYIMISELPKDISDNQIPRDGKSATDLTDRDVMELVLFGTPEDVRAALPLMSPEQKTWALKNYSAQP
jgi:hypothetical protein